MTVQSFAACCALGICFIVRCAVPVSAETVMTAWDESFDGEISASSVGPSDLGTWDGGVQGTARYRVIGSVEEIGNPLDIPDDNLLGTADLFTFEIAAGKQLDGIFLTDFTANVQDAYIFMAIDDASTFAYTPYEINLRDRDYSAELVDGWLVGRDQDQQLDPGGNLLELTGGSALRGNAPALGPLGAGSYTVYLQETGAQNSYQLDFLVSNVSAVPEPSAVFALAGLAIPVYLRRRRK